MLKSVNSLFITYNWLYIHTIIKNKYYDNSNKTRI